MAIQTTFPTSLDVCVPGQLADNVSPQDIVSGLYAPRKYVSVAVVASNSQVYTVNITPVDQLGVAGTLVAYAYTADGSATTAEIVAGLVALINAGTQPVHATGTDTPLLIEATTDADFATSYTAGTGSLTETVLVPSAMSATASADLLGDYGVVAPAGVMFVVDDRAASTRSPVARSVRLPRLAADITGLTPIGVAVETRSSEASGYRGRHMVPLLEKGRIYVKVEEAVIAGGPVYVRYASGSGGSQLGAFRTSVDSTTAALLPNARYATASFSTVNNGLMAELELRS